MDPNEVLQYIREQVERILREDAENDGERAEALAMDVQALDEWISKGGFLPTAWRQKEEV